MDKKQAYGMIVQRQVILSYLMRDLCAGLDTAELPRRLRGKVKTCQQVLEEFSKGGAT